MVSLKFGNNVFLSSKDLVVSDGQFKVYDEGNVVDAYIGITINNVHPEPEDWSYEIKNTNSIIINYRQNSIPFDNVHLGAVLEHQIDSDTDYSI